MFVDHRRSAAEILLLLLLLLHLRRRRQSAAAGGHARRQIRIGIVKRNRRLQKKQNKNDFNIEKTQTTDASKKQTLLKSNEFMRDEKLFADDEPKIDEADD